MAAQVKERELPSEALPFQTRLIGDGGELGKLEAVKLEDLNVDPAYQRDLSRELVETIKRKWKSAGAGTITVSRRKNGALYIVNGQHRVAAALELYREGARASDEIVAQIVEGRTPAEEAELRLMANTKRTDTSQERFRAQLAAGHEESLNIRAICSEFDTRINPSPDQKTGINCVSAVEAIYRIDSGTLLTRVFEAVQDAFGVVGGETASVALLKGIAWMLTRHRSDLDRQRLVERLAAEGINGIERKARNHKAASGGALWMNYYRAFVEVYNERLRQSAKLEIKTGGWSKSGLGNNTD